MGTIRKTGVLLIGLSSILLSASTVKNVWADLQFCRDNITTPDGSTCCECAPAPGNNHSFVEDTVCVASCKNGTFPTPSVNSNVCGIISSTTTSAVDNATTENSPQNSSNIRDMTSSESDLESKGQIPVSHFWCKPCDPACAICHGPSSKNCSVCEEDHEEDKTTGACKKMSSDSWKIPVIVVCSLLGVFFLVVVPVVVVVRRRIKKPKKTPKPPPGRGDLDNFSGESSSKAIYENTPSIKTLPRDIENRHDDMNRYRPDPTLRRQRGSRSLRNSISSFIQKRRGQPDATQQNEETYEVVEVSNSSVQPQGAAQTTPPGEEASPEAEQPIYENEEIGAPNKKKVSKPKRQTVPGKNKGHKGQRHRKAGGIKSVPKTSSDDSDEEDKYDYENQAVIESSQGKGGRKPSKKPADIHRKAASAYPEHPEEEEEQAIQEGEENQELYENTEMIESQLNLASEASQVHSSETGGGEGVHNPVFEDEEKDLYENMSAILKHQSKKGKKK